MKWVFGWCAKINHIYVNCGDLIEMNSLNSQSILLSSAKIFSNELNNASLSVRLAASHNIQRKIECIILSSIIDILFNRPGNLYVH